MSLKLPLRAGQKISSQREKIYIWQKLSGFYVNFFFFFTFWDNCRLCEQEQRKRNYRICMMKACINVTDPSHKINNNTKYALFTKNGKKGYTCPHMGWASRCIVLKNVKKVISSKTLKGHYNVSAFFVFIFIFRHLRTVVVILFKIWPKSWFVVLVFNVQVCSRI